MKIIKRFLYLLCALSLLTACACGYVSSDIGGTPVTPEMLDSVSRSLAQTITEPTETAKQQAEKTTAQSISTTPPSMGTTADAADTIVPSVVYWTEGGSVYHHSSDCSSLRSSENILQGSIEDALQAKKERACKRCS